MNQWIVVVVTLVIVGLGLLVYYRKRSKIKSLDKRVFKIKDDRKWTAPSGLTFWVEEGANVTEEEIAAIETGMLACFNRAVSNNYNEPLSLSDYIIAIMGDSQRAPESFIWCNKVPAAQYEGSEWDLGGYILAGGQVISWGPLVGNIIALPDHHGENIYLPNGQTDLEALAEVADNETQHIILAYCDWPRFVATRTHGIGQGHPIF